jgi:hypothetical protein
MTTAWWTATRIGERQGQRWQCDFEAGGTLVTWEVTILDWKHEGGCGSIYRP